MSVTPMPAQSENTTPDLSELVSGLKARLYARRAQHELDRQLDTNNHPWKNGSTKSPSAG